MNNEATEGKYFDYFNHNVTKIDYIVDFRSIKLNWLADFPKSWLNLLSTIYFHKRSSILIKRCILI